MPTPNPTTITAPVPLSAPCPCWAQPVSLHDGHCCFRAESFDQAANRATCGHDDAGMAAFHAARP